MSEWTRFKDKLPPIGKRIIHTSPGSDTFGILTLMYILIHEEDKEKGYPLGATEEMLQCGPGYWLEIPEIPKEFG